MPNILNRVIKYNIYLLVFLLPLFFLPFSFEAFEFNKQYLLFFLVSLAFLAWLAKMILIDKEIRFKRSPLDIFALAFLFIAILSAIFSVDKNSSLFGFYARFSDGLIGLLSLGALYFLITNNVGGDKGIIRDVKGVLRVFLWSVFFVILFSYFSIFGVWQKINQFISFPPVMLQVLFNPIAGSMEGLAVFLAIIIVLLLGSILVRDDKGKLRGIGIYFLLLAALGLLIIIDFNPAWLIILLSLIIFLTVVLWKRIFKEDINKLLLLILFVVLSAAFLFINTADIQRLVLKYYLPQEQVLGQGTSWLVGLKSATENIKSGFFGSGIGTFHYGFAKFKPTEFNQSLLWQIRFDRSGSHISELLGTMGFLGLLSYLALIGMFLLISYLFLQQNRKGIPLLMVLLALLIGQFVFYQNTVLAFAFWLALGLSAVNWHPPAGRLPLKEKTISFKDFPELSLVFSILLITLVLVFLAMYFLAIKFYWADINYRNYFITGQGQKLEKAVNLNPYQAQYKLVIARDYLNKVFIETQKPADKIDQTLLANNVQRAIALAQEATELSPNRVASWETLGMVYRDIQGIAAGALAWGISSFEKAISLEPTNPVLHTELGKLYLVSEERDKAKEKFNKAKELKPDYIDASIQIALVYEVENNLEEAIKQMEELVSFYPQDIEAIFQLGRLYFNNNRTDEAIARFEAIITFMPNHSDALYSLGLAYQRKEEKEKAIAKFERVLEINPGNEDVIQKLKELRGE